MVKMVKLTNHAAFTVRLQFIYEDSEGRKIHTGGTGNILAGSSKTVNPGDYGVPEGAKFHVYASVVAGKDKVSCEEFLYSSTANIGVEMKTTGTTLINKLVFVEYFQVYGNCEEVMKNEIHIDDFKSMQECNDSEIDSQSNCKCVR
ncbi:MAG: hypothetical protein FWC79_06085 [Oscillospiraceae bacterium]|nr:hypothetical protein [Oscillospiraceae bacterium]